MIVCLILNRCGGKLKRVHERRTDSGGHEQRREGVGDEEQDVEGLLHRRDDSRSSVQVLSRGLAEPH